MREKGNKKTYEQLLINPSHVNEERTRDRQQLNYVSVYDIYISNGIEKMFERETKNTDEQCKN